MVEELLPMEELVPHTGIVEKRVSSDELSIQNQNLLNDFNNLNIRPHQFKYSRIRITLSTLAESSFLPPN